MTYENFLKEGLITFEEFIDAYPDLFKNKDKILARITAPTPQVAPETEETEENPDQMFEEMLASMSPEQQQAFMQLSPEEQEQLVAEYQGGL